MAIDTATKLSRPNSADILVNESHVLRTCRDWSSLPPRPLSRTMPERHQSIEFIFLTVTELSGCFVDHESVRDSRQPCESPASQIQLVRCGYRSPRWRPKRHLRAVFVVRKVVDAPVILNEWRVHANAWFDSFNRLTSGCPMVSNVTIENTVGWDVYRLQG
jgi:hypothetical protein